MAIRGRETGLRGQPQERQHRAAPWRDAGPTAPGERRTMSCARIEAEWPRRACGSVHESWTAKRERAECCFLNWSMLGRAYRFAGLVVLDAKGDFLRGVSWRC